MEKQFYSSGFLATRFQLPVKVVEAELDEAGYRPTLILNEVPYWPIDAMVRLRSQHRRLTMGGTAEAAGNVE